MMALQENYGLRPWGVWEHELNLTACVNKRLSPFHVSQSLTYGPPRPFQANIQKSAALSSEEPTPTASGDGYTSLIKESGQKL